MAAKSFTRIVAGVITQVFGVQASAGATNAGDLVALTDQGIIDPSMLNGVGPDSGVLPATEAISAGQFVNVWNNSGTFSVRKADASVSGKPAHGYAPAAIASGASGTIYFSGQNTAVSGQAPGDVFLSVTSPGGTQATAPTATGQVIQRLGVAISATNIDFKLNPFYQL